MGHLSRRSTEKTWSTYVGALRDSSHGRPRTALGNSILDTRSRQSSLVDIQRPSTHGAFLVTIGAVGEPQHAFPFAATSRPFRLPRDYPPSPVSSNVPGLSLIPPQHLDPVLKASTHFHFFLLIGLKFRCNRHCGCFDTYSPAILGSRQSVLAQSDRGLWNTPVKEPGLIRKGPR